VAGDLIRILSDIHFGDRASRVHELPQLRPLLSGVTHLVLNGDTLDTRPGPFPAHTAECCAAVLDFFAREVAATTFLTGNHDPDFSARHYLDFAAGRVFVVHGDIFFEDIVPWGRDAPQIAHLIEVELRNVPAALRHDLDQRLAVFRRVAAAVPQRHQSERNPLKYLVRFLADTVWPPLRVFRILRAWREAPARAAALAQRHRPAAKFIVSGHTHRPGIWPRAGLTVINTGSYCRPLGGMCVDHVRRSRGGTAHGASRHPPRQGISRGGRRRGVSARGELNFSRDTSP
jgi:predicted phosphodiesterase